MGWADVMFLVSGVSVEPDNHWGSQINQLEQLIDKMECEVCVKEVFVTFFHFSKDALDVLCHGCIFSILFLTAESTQRESK